MAIQAKKQSPWLMLVIIAAAVIIPAIQRKKADADPRKIPPPQAETRPSEAGAPSASPRKQNGYEVYRSCSLVTDRQNDGDSFRVRLPDGREEIMRLYFVDTPETAFKSYGGGENNHQRIAEQARDLGVTPEEAVEIGRRAKKFTLDRLAKQPFTVFTEWDSPFNDRRYHAFIELPDKTLLHQLLIQNHLARLKTKPADLPDGTRASRHREQLEAIR